MWSRSVTTRLDDGLSIAAQAESQAEQGGRGRLVEADLGAASRMEEIGDEVPDAGMQGGGRGLAGDDGSRHRIQPALGLAGGFCGRVDGQAAGPGVEIGPGPAQGIPVDHREPGPDPGIQDFERDNGFLMAHGVGLSRGDHFKRGAGAFQRFSERPRRMLTRRVPMNY